MSTANPDPNLIALDADFASTPYRVLGYLGQGGMGAVYEVEHRALGRKLVLKVLRELNRPDLEDRLRLEAQTLAQLSHPNLLQVIDFGHTPSGRPFLVSERLYGKTLKELLGTTGALSVREAIRFVTQALAALAVAHRAGVVHRDVKLDNLFLCDGDDVSPSHLKVIDFGIVKLVGADGGEPAVKVAPLEVPTAEGIMVGTPSFMSPEQITNQSVDHRADIYGVGVVLYRLLTGRNPFICRDLIDYAAAHASQIPAAPSTFVPLPPALDAIILRALSKRADDRFASAKEMIDALAPFAQSDARPSGPDAREIVSPESAPTNPLKAPSAGPRTPQATQRMLESPARGTVRIESLPSHPTGQLGFQATVRDAYATPQRALPAPPYPPVHSGSLNDTALAPRASAARTGRTVEVVALIVAAVSVGAIIWFVMILLGAFR